MTLNFFLTVLMNAGIQKVDYNKLYCVFNAKTVFFLLVDLEKKVWVKAIWKAVLSVVRCWKRATQVQFIYSRLPVADLN